MTFVKPSTPHQFLAQLVGGWVGRVHTWLEPEGVPIEIANARQYPIDPGWTLCTLSLSNFNGW